MKVSERHVHLLAAAGKIRTASYQKRDHIVMPVTALVEGVLHAVNSPIPELVLAEEFGLSAYSWNGRPVMMNHPEIRGQKVSANDPRILEEFSFGHVFNTRARNGELTMEAWIDPVRAREMGGDALRTLERIEIADPNDPIEVSVGVFMVAEATRGVKNGKQYQAVWRHITPDHLAILPEGKVGACSVAMGCGIRHAPVYMATAEGYQEIRQAGDKPGHPFHGNQYKHFGQAEDAAQKSAAETGMDHYVTSSLDPNGVTKSFEVTPSPKKNWVVKYTPRGDRHKPASVGGYPGHWGSSLKVNEGEYMAEDLRSAGGPGSGFHGHKGRKGQVGGSAKTEGVVDPEAAAKAHRVAAIAHEKAALTYSSAEDEIQANQHTLEASRATRKASEHTADATHDDVVHKDLDAQQSAKAARYKAGKQGFMNETAAHHREAAAAHREVAEHLTGGSPVVQPRRRGEVPLDMDALKASIERATKSQDREDKARGWVEALGGKVRQTTKSGEVAKGLVEAADKKAKKFRRMEGQSLWQRIKTLAFHGDPTDAEIRTAVDQVEEQVDERQALLEQLQELEPDALGIVSSAGGRVVYQMNNPDGDGVLYYQRNYAGDVTGYIIDDDATEVKQALSFEPIEDNDEEDVDELELELELDDESDEEPESDDAPGDEITAAEGCSCHSRGDIDMKKQDRIKALMAHPNNPVKDQEVLEALEDSVFEALEAHATKLDADQKVAQEQAAALKAAEAAAAPKELTEEELMKAAPAALRTMIERHKAADAQAHATLVTSLKTAQKVHSEEALKALPLERLQEIAALLQMPPVDYSLRSLPRAAESTEGDYKRQPPPDGYAAALEARRKTTH
jgi:hypothetical protein